MGSNDDRAHGLDRGRAGTAGPGAGGRHGRLEARATGAVGRVVWSAANTLGMRLGNIAVMVVVVRLVGVVLTAVIVLLAPLLAAAFATPEAVGPIGVMALCLVIGSLVAVPNAVLAGMSARTGSSRPEWWPSSYQMPC
jgi:Polysaccharide biosynthesis protein